MAATAFLVGFFTAMGWWSAHQVINTVVESPPAMIKQQQEKKK
jgi:hypothetical protein